MDSDSVEWQPPTEAEEKLMQARRERADKVSKLMGDYLLRGWKMLATYCDDCGTILLQNKQGKNYCVACNELTSDTDKDNPALSLTAAQSQAREHQRVPAGKKITTTAIVSSNGPICSKIDSDSSEEFVVSPALGSASAPQTRRELSTAGRERPKRSALPPLEGPSANGASFSKQKQPLATSDVYVNIDDTRDVLFEKLDWATNQLKLTTSVELSTQLCKLIKAASEALHAVRQLNTGYSAAQLNTF